ncbi:DUF547 domain-containing protein [Maribacter sp. 2307ULW6-5]|uniref:DUF547 domain-containing protein n=1 Tax=Maribacter sp. 2307ULW6-5 TaxID=3386275 RepID=UPI0039BD6E69
MGTTFRSLGENRKLSLNVTFWIFQVFFDGTLYEIGGKSITLNDIKHQLLRENFSKYPRFHFVLVCGALGCPPVMDNHFLKQIGLQETV